MVRRNLIFFNWIFGGLTSSPPLLIKALIVSIYLAMLFLPLP